MLRIVAHGSAAAARQYYAEGLKREDYYSEGQEIVGKWHGKAAARLGLEGEVRPEAFAALVENRHPDTGAKLTPRLKENRRVGYDLNFHAPKSLSVLQALTGDDRLTAVFREAVSESMAELEERVGTRVRKGGDRGNRVTGNFAWAEFVHFTARPVGGVPDPHLHVHAFAFNLTHDPIEDRWKAAEFHDIKKDAPYAEAVFHSKLASKVRELGYSVQRTKTGWEVVGVPGEVLRKFSRRTGQIEALAKELGLTDSKKKDALGAISREGKRHGISRKQLQTEWKSRLIPEEWKQLSSLRWGGSQRIPNASPHLNAKAALDYALEKGFAKDSVAVPSRLVAEALKHAVGSVKPEALWRELSRRPLITREVKGQLLCTTLEVLAEEASMIDFVRSGRGRFPALAGGRLSFQDQRLSVEQQKALSSILGSRSRVIAVRGAAGVGKTTLMQEAARQIEATGKQVFAFAPSAAASRDTLREAGFAEADTVARLLHSRSLQERIQGQVLWIDEAGLLGTRDLGRVLALAGERTRIILTGDSGQHAPVARGDAFRLVQRYAGLPVVEVTQIRRQEREIYRQAVTSLSRGDLASAFRRLEEMGAFVEVEDDAARYRRLAEDYLSFLRKDPPPLVVSPTHVEGDSVTAAIRSALRDAGRLGKEREFLQYRDLRWDNADKGHQANYREGLVVQFHQNAKGIRRGEQFTVIQSDGAGVMLRGTGRDLTLPLANADRFQVYEMDRLALASGDRIRITRNGESLNGKRLNNGNGYEVAKIKPNGNILLKGGVELSAGHGHFAHGYCQTSHSSQSKSVGQVLVAQSSKSFVASSREQFYVSVSRAKEGVKIYTDDLPGLREAVGLSSVRLSGLELAGLTPKDISAMSNALKSHQWRDIIKSRRPEGEVQSHVSNLLRERHQTESLKKPKNMSWRGYVEMRRGLTGADGKSRSKGHPEPPQKRTGSDMAQRRRSFLRPTELTTTTMEQLKAGQAAKKSAQPKETQSVEKNSANRLMRAVAAVKNSAANLSRLKGQDQSAKPEAAKQKALTAKGLKASSPEQAAKRSVKAKTEQARKTASAKIQKTKTKGAVPPPPGLRK